jgi:hypothetical protein
MNPTNYLGMLVETYNPNKYAKLVERPMREFISFLIMTVLVALFLFCFFIIPVTYHYANTIPERMENVQQLVLSAEVNATGPTVLVAQPHITMDLEANTTRSGFLTLTRQGILYPKYLFFGTSAFPWSNVQDLKQQTAERDRLITGIIIFLLPSLLFWFFLFSFFLCALLFLSLVVLGYFVPRIFKHKLTFFEAVKVAIISMPSILLFGLGLYPLAVLTVLWIATLLTIILCGIGVAIVSELDMPEERRKHHGKV